MRARRVGELRAGAGPAAHGRSRRAGVHPGACARHPGGRAPGDGGGGPHASTTSPTRRGSSRWTWRARSGTSRATSRSSRLLDHLGGYVGEFPETTILWRCACAEDAAARVAGVNRGLEGLACDVFDQLVDIARRLPDPTIERAVDYVLADEITHVRMGSLLAQQAHRGRSRAPAAGRRVPGVHRRALQPRRRAAGGPAEEVPIAIAPSTRAAGRLHRRGDRAARQEHAALSGLLSLTAGHTLVRGPPSRLAGHLAVETTARRVRHYRYAEERMMRVLAGLDRAHTRAAGQAAVRPPGVGLRPARRPVGPAPARAARPGAGVGAAERPVRALHGRAGGAGGAGGDRWSG